MSIIEVEGGYPVGWVCGVWDATRARYCRQQATDYYVEGARKRNVCRSHWDKGKPPPIPLAVHFETVDLGG